MRRRHRIASPCSTSPISPTSTSSMPESPGRFEFIDRFHGLEPLHLLLPSYRPQEFLQVHACEAMLRSLNAVASSPLTGAPLQLVLFSGTIPTTLK